jgi:hypothetical protein
VKNNQLQWTRLVFVLVNATIEVHVLNDVTGASSSSVPTHQQSPVSASLTNIYRLALI